ncbi:MAG: hypothetical protein R3F43_30920 [bacterium]
MHRRWSQQRGRPSPAPACGNGVDDDDDGLIDFPLDPAARAPGTRTRPIRPMPPACANGVDDDDSGAADYPDDPGCLGAGDATEVSPCGAGSPVIDLNRHLAQNAAYDGDLRDAPAHLVATCGGAAGGERVFLYDVDHPLDRLVFTTQHPETEAPVVMYLRDTCQGADVQCDRGLADSPGATLTLTRPAPAGTTSWSTPAAGWRSAASASPSTRSSRRSAAMARTTTGTAGSTWPIRAAPRAKTPTRWIPPRRRSANDLDDDGDGRVDSAGGSRLLAAGGPEEAPPCALNSPIVRPGQDGGEV